MEISKRTMSEILRNSNDLIIPFYQREYRWNEIQIKRLLQDIDSCQTNNYYLGSLVFKTQKSSKIVIDGQQRISTIWLIIKAIYDNKAELEIGYSNEIEQNLKYFKFKTLNLKDGEILKNIVNNTTSSFGVEEEKSNYSLNYKQIKKYIAEMETSLDDFYTNFNKIVVSQVIAEEKIDEHILFSQINSTGIKLSAFELVKNYLFSKINELYLNDDDLDIKIEEKTNLLRQATKHLTQDKDKDDFIRHFISYKTNELINKDISKLYTSFANLFDQSSSKYIYDNALTAFDDLYSFSIFYKYISQRKKWAESKFATSMNMLYPSLNTYMTLLVDIFYNNSSLKEKKICISKNQENTINKSLLILEFYKVNREFCRFGEKSITRFIPKLVNDIKKIKLDISYETKLYYLLSIKPNKEINKQKDFKYRMPTKNELEVNFSSFQIYKKQKFCKLFLSRISSFRDKMVIDFATFSIEHILPQTLTKWRDDGYDEDEMEITKKTDTIGNLTLTNYNGEASNNIFSKKQEIMKTENWKFNNYLLNLEKWNLEEIGIRSKHLFDKVNDIWNFQEIKEEIDSFSEELDD